MTKMTREERRQAAFEAREKASALEFKAEMERERGKVVVTDYRSSLAARDLAAPGGEQLLSRSLYEYERLLGDYETKLKWRASDIETAQLYLAERRFYGSVPVQNVDDLTLAYGRLTQAAEALASVCRALNVHCPALHSEADEKARAKMLSYGVRENLVESGWVIQNENGDRAAVNGELLPVYAEEWHAWRSLRTLTQ